MLALIDKGIWTYRQDLRLLGIDVGTRMTLIEIEPGELLAISPIKMTDSVLRQIESAGKIKWIVGPNNYHHIYLNSCIRAFPEAVSFAPRSLIKKRQDINFQGVIEEGETYPWEKAAEHHVFRASDKFTEVLFFHPLSKTLIVTDFVFNLKDPDSLFKKLMARGLKISGKLQMSRLMSMVLRNPEALQQSLAKIEEWAPKRLIMAHGDLVEGDVSGLLKEATLS